MKKPQNLQHGFIRLRAALIIVGGLMVVGLLFVMLTPKDPVKQRASTNPNGYEAAAKQFVKAMSHREGNTSYNLFTDRYKKIVGSEADWQKQLDEGFKDEDGSPKFVKAEPQSDPAGIYKGKEPQRVTYEFEIKGVKWHTIMIVLKDKDSWKIDESQSESQ